MIMQFDPQKIYWQAHRGGGGHEAPDNTLCAMEYAWSMGGIPEADIRVTSDGEIVCLHDNNLARTTDAPEDIAGEIIGKLPLSVVQKYDAGKKFDSKFAGQHVPSLPEVFEKMQQDRSKMLYADIKNYDEKFFPKLIKRFTELVNKYNTASQIIVAGCDYELNCRFKQEIPEIKTMQWIGFDPVKRMQQFMMLAEKEFAGLDLVQLHLYIKPEPHDNWIYDLPIEDLQKAVSILGARLEVFPFGKFTQEAIDTLLKLGIKQFATDEPMRFCQTLKTLGA